MELKPDTKVQILYTLRVLFPETEVFGAAATGSYGVVGDPTFDEVAFDKIIDAAAKNFARKFK